MAGSRIGVCVHCVALNTWCERCPSGKRYQITVSEATVNNTQETPDSPQPTDEPRAIIRHFALAMERKLAANDGVKGGWRDYDWMLHYRALMAEMGELLEALRALEDAGRWGNEESAEREAVLQEAADCANYLMMICDVVGALPPTDERGR